MKFKQIFKMIKRLNEKQRIVGLNTDEKELLAELKFLIKILGHQIEGHKLEVFDESLGVSSNACPVCGRSY